MLWSWASIGACLITAAGNLPLEIASSSALRAVKCCGVENCTDFLCADKGRSIKLEFCTYMRAFVFESSIDVSRRIADASFDICEGVELSSSPYDGGSKLGGVFGRYIVTCDGMYLGCKEPRERYVVFMKPSCVQRKGANEGDLLSRGKIYLSLESKTKRYSQRER